jgi:hypothetical protein
LAQPAGFRSAATVALKNRIARDLQLIFDEHMKTDDQTSQLRAALSQ